MSAGSIELPLACAGHAGKLHVTLSEANGWDVCVKLDDHIITQAHCGDWHRVERLRARVEAQLRATRIDEGNE
jgi:hypothetical protein